MILRNSDENAKRWGRKDIFKEEWKCDSRSYLRI